MKIGSIMVPLVAIMVPLAGATGQTLSPTNVFDASTTTPITGGATAGALPHRAVLGDCRRTRRKRSRPARFR